MIPKNQISVSQKPDSDKKSTPLYKKLVILISFTGAAIQCIIYILNYLKYPTTTNVMIYNPETAELPATSVCFFFKLDQLGFEKNMDGQNQTTLTLAEIDKRLPKFNEFVKWCYVMDSDYQYRNCVNSNTQVVEYLSLYSKCYTLFANQNPPIQYDQREIANQWIAKILFNVSIIYSDNIGIQLTHTDEELEEAIGNLAFSQFDSYNYNQAVVTYERTTIDKLEKPYDSNCVHYSKFPCKNRPNCIRQCMLQSSYDKYKAWSPSRYITLKQDYIDGRFDTGIDEKNITHECHEKYPHSECRGYIYNALVTSEIMAPYYNNDTFLMYLSFPLGTETKVEYASLSILIQLIFFLTSIINLWTGISVVWLVNSFIDILILLVPRSNQTKAESASSSRTFFVTNKSLQPYSNRKSYRRTSSIWTSKIESPGFLSRANHLSPTISTSHNWR